MRDKDWSIQTDRRAGVGGPGRMHGPYTCRRRQVVQSPPRPARAHQPTLGVSNLYLQSVCQQSVQHPQHPGEPSLTRRTSPGPQASSVTYPSSPSTRANPHSNITWASSFLLDKPFIRQHPGEPSLTRRTSPGPQASSVTNPLSAKTKKMLYYDKYPVVCEIYRLLRPERLIAN